MAREKSPIITTEETPFEIGKALTLWQSENPKVTILSTGSLSYAALVAANELSKNGVESSVLHFPTVKPLDEEAILNAAKQAGRVVTIEEHQIAGGFGSAIAEFLSEKLPVPIKRIGVQDRFGQSGEPEELLAYYGLDAVHIQEAARGLVGI